MRHPGATTEQPDSHGQTLNNDREENDRRWRKLGVIGTFADALARVVEIVLRR